MRRRLALLAVLGLAVTAGCVGGGLDREALAANATYQWDTDADATINVTGDRYRGVYHLDNGSSLPVYRLDSLGSEQPVPIEALRFRYPNGTVVGPGDLRVERQDARTVVTPPANGTVAFIAPAGSKSFRTPAFRSGSHEVILPRNVRIGVPLLGTASPGGYSRSIEADGRVHMRWDDLDAGTEIDLQYYLQRDFYIFGGLVAGLTLLGVLGVLYFRRQIRALAARREATDLED
jgi:hypothetical protein